MYKFGEIIQGTEDAWLPTFCFSLHVQKTYGSMETWAVVEDVGNWRQRNEAESGETDDRMCDKCSVALVFC